jgi:N-hydroxyarylamine O-acetyltransferase
MREPLGHGKRSYNREMGGSLDLEAYLDRIGRPQAGAATLATLAELQQAHCAAIPFENLDILLGRPIGLELAQLQAKLVSGGRGGYCFEQNTLFEAALRALGFGVTPLAARVRAGSTGLRPRTHMLLLVDLLEGTYLADVGFGGNGPLRPVPLEDGAVVRCGAFSHRLRGEDQVWVLQEAGRDGWSDLYAFTLEPQFPVDFEMANHFTSTHPRSAFVLNLTVQRSWPERRAVLRNRDFVVATPEGETMSTVRDPDHLLEILAGEFSLSFPAGTRFRRPEF